MTFAESLQAEQPGALIENPSDAETYSICGAVLLLVLAFAVTPHVRRRLSTRAVRQQPAAADAAADRETAVHG